MTARRLLLTNDDGVHSAGLHELAVALRRRGHAVTVAAPTSERSGSGAAVGYLAHGVEFDVVAHPLPDADGIPTYGVDGPPALCVLTAMLEVFGPRPDLVVSGTNPGTNCGRGVLQSGTVGAALIAQNFGLSALAVSQAVGDPMQWATANEVAAAALDWLAEAPRKTVLNVNVPDRPVDSLAGVRWARLAAFGTTTTSLVGEVPGTLRVHVTPRDVELRADTDTHLVDEGFVTVTGLIGVRSESEESAAAAPALEAALGVG